MTTQTEKPLKRIPALYIFTQDAEGNSKHSGAAFRHTKGNGFNILIGSTWYVAFPPKAKSETEGE